MERDRWSPYQTLNGDGDGKFLNVFDSVGNDKRRKILWVW